MPGSAGDAVFKVTSDTKEFTAGLKAAKGAAADFAKQTSGKFKQSTASVRGVTSALGGLAAAAGLKQIVRDVSASTKAFQTNMSTMEGLVGISRDQLKEWEGDIKKLAPQLGIVPEKLSEAMFFVTSAGLRGERALDALKHSARGAKGGLGDLSIVADAVTSALNAYPPSILSAEKATDILVATVREGKLEAAKLAPVIGDVIPLAAQMGVEFEQVGAMIAALSRTGSDAPKAVSGLRAALRSLARPSQQASKELDTAVRYYK